MSNLADDITKIDLGGCSLTGNVNLDFEPSESKFDWFILGEIGDFTKNVNLVELWLNGNNLTGNVNLDFQPSIQNSMIHLF